MLKYLLSLSLLFSLLQIEAQENKLLKNKEKGNPGIAVGIDLAPFINSFFNDERYGVEANARYSFQNNWFIVGELGYENVDLREKHMDYTSDGSFIRLGFDYNIFNVDERDNNDNILLGMRYAFAVQEHQSPKFTVEDSYWGNVEGSIGSTTVNSQWAEFIFGMRSEVLKNFYMGWTVRLRTLISVDTNNKLDPYSIPGYGRHDRSPNMGFTYTLEYHLPFKRKK